MTEKLLTGTLSLNTNKSSPCRRVYSRLSWESGLLPASSYTALFFFLEIITIDFPKSLASYLSHRTQLSSPCLRVYNRLSPRVWPLTCLIVHSSLLLVWEYTIDFPKSLASYLSHHTQLSSPCLRVYSRLFRESGTLELLPPSPPLVPGLGEPSVILCGSPSLL